MPRKPHTPHTTPNGPNLSRRHHPSWKITESKLPAKGTFPKQPVLPGERGTGTVAGFGAYVSQEPHRSWPLATNKKQHSGISTPMRLRAPGPVSKARAATSPGPTKIKNGMAAKVQFRHSCVELELTSNITDWLADRKHTGAGTLLCLIPPFRRGLLWGRPARKVSAPGTWVHSLAK